MKIRLKTIVGVLSILIAFTGAAPDMVFGATFMDVADNHWANEEISKGVEMGIVSGYPDRTFRPDTFVTYPEFIKMTVTATGEDPGPSSGKDWSKNYMDLARKKGFFRSLNRTNPCFNLPISRYHAAMVLSDVDAEWEMSEIEVQAAKMLMVDTRKFDGADSIARVISKGIMQGYQDMKFRPNDPITRAEAVCAILRLVVEERRLDTGSYFNEVAALSKGKEEEPEETEVISLPWQGEEKDYAFDPEAFEAEAFRVTNIQRENAGRPLLKYDNALAAVAREKARDMVVNSYYNHISPTYGSPFEMMVQFGIEFSCAGENIAYGFNTPEGVVVDGWMESPPHKETMLSERVTRIGIGCWNSGTRIYWVQMFIKPIDLML